MRGGGLVLKGSTRTRGQLEQKKLGLGLIEKKLHLKVLHFIAIFRPVIRKVQIMGHMRLQMEPRGLGEDFWIHCTWAALG